MFKSFFLLLLFIIFTTSPSFADVLCNNETLEDSMRTQVLDEITVNSQYRYIKRKGDKFVVSFKGSSFFEGKTIAEGLGLCPFISRQNNLFQILGKESTVIYINGRPSTLSGEDLMAYLDTKQIDEIERVEIITMPSGKFADANKSGVINIVMTQNRNMGAMAMINAGAMKGSCYGGQTSGMFALTEKDVNINIFANYANQNKTRISKTLYEFPEDEHVWEFSDFTQHGKPFATTCSIEWKKRKNLIGCSYTYSSLMLDADYLNSSSYSLAWMKNSNIKNHYNMLQIYDDWNIGKSTIKLLYALYDRRNKANDVYSANNILRHIDYNKHGINNIKVNVNSKLSDDWEIEYGVSGNYLLMLSDFSYDEWVNSVKYKESVWKGYFLTSNEFGHWGITAGFNFEHTKQDFVGNKKTYSRWFPNFNVTYKNDWGQFYGQFSKTIERVPYSSITLSPVYFSPQSTTIGNPELKPEEGYNVSFGMNKGNLSVEMFCKRYKNVIIQYAYTDNDCIINSFTNLNNENQYGVNISYSRAISTVLLSKINCSSYYVNSDAMEIGKSNSWNNYLTTALFVRFDKKKRFDADIHYWVLFPQKERGVEWKYRGSFDMNINYNVIPSIFRFTLSVKDLFNQDFAYYSRMYKNANVINKNTFDNRKFIIAIRYTLSNNKRVGKNQQKSIDELRRIPTE